MTVCEGDVAQYSQIKSGTCELYIIKLDNFVSKIERANKAKGKTRII